MTSQDLAEDRKTSRAAGLAGSFRGIVAKTANFAIRQSLSWRLRFVISRRSSADAEAYFMRHLARTARDSGRLSRLASAALRGARAAERRGAWLAASGLWIWYARASGDVQKAGRNLIQCARATTKANYEETNIAEALQCWKLLQLVQPNAAEAQQGIAWCHAALARFAEERLDWLTAKRHWVAVLDISPEHHAASVGLRRAADAEAAEALRNTARARVLYEQLNASIPPTYGAKCAAAQQVFDAGAPHLAREFIDKALAHKRGPEALLLLFRCQLAQSNLDEALASFIEFVGLGDIGAIPAVELRRFLEGVAPGRVPQATIVNIARVMRDDAQYQPALLPHLFVYSMHAEIAAAADSAVAGRADWPEILVLETARQLIKAELREHALRLLARFSTRPNVGKAFIAVAETWPAHQLEAVILDGARHSDTTQQISALAIAEYYGSKSDWPGVTHLLARIGEAAKRLPALDRDRLGALVAQGAADADPSSKLALARFVGAQLSELGRDFFASQGFAGLCDELEAASHLQKAPSTSMTAQFREHYFEHYMERHENKAVDLVITDFALCDTVLRYFTAMARFRPVESIPVPKDLKARVSASSLHLNGGSADVLMTYALLRDRTDLDLTSNNPFARIAEWYVSSFMPSNHVPSCCIGPDVLAYFNTADFGHSSVGVLVTPFANLIWSKPAEFALQYRAANPLDALLASLEAIPTLSRYPQYRRFFSAMLPMSERSTFADLCISALSGKKEQCFSRLLSGDAEERLEIKERIDRVQQDVLLIGHGGGGTGLSRNSRMLENALDGGDIALTTLSYETEPDRFADALRRWYAACGRRPIVIAAINAQDIPAVFARDRHGVLEDCHVVGFFLWETSKAPSVQRLGISLVDEIWVPTHYVAEVYAHLARTFVVGKGLFHPDDKPTRHLRGPGPLRFLTVFDFHSSIERKNPLASVLAFRNAFQDAEDVEMVVKASNVNPQHPGNALGQWERLCLEAAQDSRIRIITERYSEGQMNSLLSQADCVVSLHRSEGFGYVLADAMALGIPVIATAYSGNLDFCDADTCFPVDYRLVQVQAVGTHWESEGAVWADADTVLAAAQMRRVYEDYPLALHLAATGQDRILGKYSTAAFATTLRTRISAIRNSECAIDRHS